MPKKFYKNKILSVIRITLSIVLVIFLFAGEAEDVYAARKKKTKSRRKKVRVYNPSQTKANAITKLQTSTELSELAKIEPTASANSESRVYKKEEINVADDTQMLSDVDILKTFLTMEEIIDIQNGDEGEELDELEAEDDIKVNLDDFRSLWLLAIGSGGDNAKTSFGVEKELMMELIMQWIGTPYRFGGMSKKAIDCSAWTRVIFFQADSVVIPRTAREQFTIGRHISRNHLEFGDMVFFHTYSRKFASHVGIYLGDNLFAHASSKEGVTVSSLNSTFYNNRFIGGRRLSESDLYAYKRGSVNGVLD